ncbi:MAG: hypothetical protein V2A74_09615 [bacterium]
MKEKLLALWKKIKSNVDRSVLIFFCILFAMMALIYIHEVTRPQPDWVEPTPVDLPVLLPSSNYQKIMGFMAKPESQSPELEKDETYAIIGKFNMFDVKTVKDAETLEKEANEKMKTARKAFDEERYQEAKQLVNEVLVVLPSHLEANALKQQIAAKLNPPPVATPTPAPANPPAGAVVGVEY